MGFSFGFDEEGDSTTQYKTQQVTTLSNVQTRESKIHSLKDILSTLNNVRISYEEVPNTSHLFRRQLHDVKHQLMMEDNFTKQGDEFDILIGSSDVDLKKGVYEGGLKSWECAYDCIKYLSEMDECQSLIEKGGASYLEIGCGTSLPSLYILQKLLQGETRDVRMVLTDYNYEVLRLVTVPNLFLTWYLTTTGVNLNSYNDILVTNELIDSFLNDIANKNIEISFISGGWSTIWMDQLQQLVTLDKLLMVTSETIYSPETAPLLAEIVEKLYIGGAISLVAAKDFYFGVGGSVEDFLSLLTSKSDIQLTSRDRVAGSVWRSLLRFQK